MTYRLIPDAGEAKTWIDFPIRAGWGCYAINHAEDEFLVLATDASLARAPISLFLNWQEELKRR